MILTQNEPPWPIHHRTSSSFIGSYVLVDCLLIVAKCRRSAVASIDNDISCFGKHLYEISFSILIDSRFYLSIFFCLILSFVIYRSFFYCLYLESIDNSKYSYSCLCISNRIAERAQGRFSAFAGSRLRVLKGPEVYENYLRWHKRFFRDYSVNRKWNSKFNRFWRCYERFGVEKGEKNYLILLLDCIII